MNVNRSMDPLLTGIGYQSKHRIQQCQQISLYTNSQPRREMKNIFKNNIYWNYKSKAIYQRDNKHPKTNKWAQMQEKTQYCDAKSKITGFYSSKVKTNNNKYEGTEEHRFGTMCCRPFSVFEPGTYVSGNTSWLQGNPLTQESSVIQTAITLDVRTAWY